MITAGDTWTAIVGRFADGGRMVVTVDVRAVEPGLPTVWHDVTGADALTVSFVGHAYDYRRREPFSVGQNVRRLADVVTPAPGWTLPAIAELAELWERWHLSHMRAACAHMDVTALVREPDRYGGSQISSTAPENVCAVTGYRYGSAWLAEPVPAAVLERVAAVMCSRPTRVGFTIRTRFYGPTDTRGSRYVARGGGRSATVSADDALGSADNHAAAAAELARRLGVTITGGGYVESTGGYEWRAVAGGAA